MRYFIVEVYCSTGTDDQLGNLGFYLSANLIIYTAMQFSCSGELAMVKYYPVQGGTFYMSVWRNLYGKAYQMTGKIKIDVAAADANTIQVCLNCFKHTYLFVTNWRTAYTKRIDPSFLN